MSFRDARSTYRRGWTLAALAACVWAAGCSDHPLSPRHVTLSLRPDSVRLVAVDQTLQLQLDVRDNVGRRVRAPVVAWSSDDPETVVVDQRGRVTAMRDGRATITVEAGDLRESTVIVVQATVRNGAWITALANTDFDPTNDSDSVAVVVRAGTERP